MLPDMNAAPPPAPSGEPSELSEPSPLVAEALRDPGVLTDRFLDEWTAALPPEYAEALAGWRASDELDDALREYFERANEGELSREQRRGYEELSHMANLVNLLRLGAADRAGVPPADPVVTPATAGDRRAARAGSHAAPRTTPAA